MPAWSEARRAGSQARSKAQIERSSSSASKSALPRAKERWENGVCIYCGSKASRRVGLLAITGKVYFCKNHRKQYQTDKPWEEIHKKGL